jgi:hypothetical protein
MMVMLTDWEQDHEGGNPADSRELGYPFNRPFPPGQRIADLVSLPNVATRNLWINHVAP